MFDIAVNNHRKQRQKKKKKKKSTKKEQWNQTLSVLFYHKARRIKAMEPNTVCVILPQSQKNQSNGTKHCLCHFTTKPEESKQWNQTLSVSFYHKARRIKAMEPNTVCVILPQSQKNQRRSAAETADAFNKNFRFNSFAAQINNLTLIPLQGKPTTFTLIRLQGKPTTFTLIPLQGKPTTFTLIPLRLKSTSSRASVHIIREGQNNITPSAQNNISSGQKITRPGRNNTITTTPLCQVKMSFVEKTNVTQTALRTL